MLYEIKNIDLAKNTYQLKSSIKISTDKTIESDRNSKLSIKKWEGIIHRQKGRSRLETLN